MKLQQWAHWAEITASFAVVVTLILLIQEVQGNTRAIERQAALDRASALNSPFLDNAQLASVLAKIKAVDGQDPIPEAYVERYSLTQEEAIIWERHVWQVWSGFQADFLEGGPSEDLIRILQLLLQEPDHQLYWELAAQDHNPGFHTFVDGLVEGL
jgi:hypothetical protein